MRRFDVFSLKSAVLGLTFLMLAGSCSKEETPTTPTNLSDQVDSKIAQEWSSLAVTIVKDAPGFVAPVAARSFAYLSMGLYLTSSYGNPAYSSFTRNLEGIDQIKMPSLISSGQIDWNQATNEMCYHLIKALYRSIPAANNKMIEDLYLNSAASYDAQASMETKERSRDLGVKMAEAVYAYSKTDGQDEAFVNNYPNNFKIPEGAGVWSPINTAGKKPLLPYWGSVRTFSNLTNVEIVDATPPQFSEEKNSEMYSYALEVRNRTFNLNYEEETVVKYWNDDQKNGITTPGHMLLLTLNLIKQENKSLPEASAILMKVTMAMHDAIVTSWKTIFTYNTVRPENYIRNYIDARFISLVNTPATPEFCSAQASIASATAEVLGSIFGYNYSFTDATHFYRKDIDGNPRTYRNFTQMAEEIALSNLYGGINYRFSLEAGLKQGSEVGRLVSNL